MYKVYVILTLTKGKIYTMEGKVLPLKRPHKKYLKTYVEQRHGYLRKSKLTALLEPREIISA